MSPAVILLAITTGIGIDCLIEPLIAARIAIRSMFDSLDIWAVPALATFLIGSICIAIQTETLLKVEVTPDASFTIALTAIVGTGAYIGIYSRYAYRRLRLK